MRNVYEQIKFFYDKNITWEPIVKKEWVEDFLRRKAWHGVDDEALKNMWYQLQMFIVYLDYANSNLDEMEINDYFLAIQWLGSYMEFEITLESVKSFFEVLIDFYTYLFHKKIIVCLDEIKKAADEIAGGDTLNLSLLEDSDEDGLLLVENNTTNSVLSNDMGEVIGKTVESLMLKIGHHFQQEIFTADFDRALYLYTGPFENIEEGNDEDFWLGFWDYFLFDYHLLEHDLTPIEYVNEVCSDQLNNEEKTLLEDLLSAKFTVFYINKILNQDLVECVNLFTGEIFELPFPDYDYKTLKKLLFFGHIFSKGSIMINYVTSIEISANLRRRIKDEVLRQHKIFKIQSPEANLTAFFKRHALAVRHTINILVTFAKVNVTSQAQVDRVFPQIEKKSQPNAAVICLLNTLAHDYGFSRYDTILINKMWYDFCQLAVINIRKPAVWAATIIFIYSAINSINNIAVEDIAAKLNISAKSIYRNKLKVYTALELQKFDARYLSEEGFVISLFLT